MDDAADGGYARAPELEDLLGLCRALNAEGARYVLIGGFAVILHGSVRGTKDIDLLVEASDENVRALKRALGVLADNAARDLSEEDVRSYQVVRVADEIVVDLMGSACGIDYAEALESGVERVRIEDVEIPIASKPLLIRTKDTLRDSDRSDVAFLRALIAEEQKTER